MGEILAVRDGGGLSSIRTSQADHSHRRALMQEHNLFGIGKCTFPKLGRKEPSSAKPNELGPSEKLGNTQRGRPKCRAHVLEKSPPTIAPIFKNFTVLMLGIL